MQRIQALNALGKKAHPRAEWAYKLLASCHLSVTVDRKGQRQHDFTVPMFQTWDIAVRRGVDSDATEVILLAGQAPGQSSTQVFQSTDRIDALQVQSILRFVLADCRPQLATRQTIFTTSRTTHD